MKMKKKNQSSPTQRSVVVQAAVFRVNFLPIHVLLRFQSRQHSTGEGSLGEVEVESMHPGVFIQL